MNYINVFDQGGISLKGIKEYQEAIQKAGLDYTVSARPVYHRIPIEKNGKQTRVYRSIEQYRAITRDDNQLALGIVSSSYRSIQNSEAFSIANDFVNLGAKFANGGTLFSGRIAYLQLDLGQFKIGKDPIEKKLTIITSHDGSLPLMVAFTPIRFFCQNQIATISRESVVKIRHTRFADRRMQEAKKILISAGKWFKQKSIVFTRMTEIPIDDQKLDLYLARVLNVDLEKKPERTKLMNEIVEVFHTSPAIVEVNETNGTLWGAFNAITEYYDHHNEKTKGQLTNALRTQTSAHIVRQKAYKVALEFLNN